MADKYSINRSTLESIADIVRAITGDTEKIKGSNLRNELERAISGIEAVLDSTGVKFSNEKADPDVKYKVGRNWLSDLVAVTQNMAGKKSDMTLEDILYWLNRVQFIPQGNAEISLYLSFESSARGILPDVQIGTAESVLMINFESSVSGTLDIV